jgi:lipopolysaccharide/colanic/teichoic acid biosynthesis glycosyltransferase
MLSSDTTSSAWVAEGTNRVTRVGAFLRRTSIDELPQIFSVFKGDLSLIGPRSDIRGLGERLKEEVPLYQLRYHVTPGISGWAQVNQRYAPGHISPQSIEESRVRLMYDLYYVRHRSVFLDLYIAAKTIRTLLTRLIP